MTTFLETVDGDCFVKCDDCRGLHNNLDVGLITDTIILCTICRDRIFEGEKKRRKIVKEKEI